MACLDTDILVALLRGDGEAIKVLEDLQRAGELPKTTIITAYELFKGAAASAKPVENIRIVEELLQNLTVLGLDVEACKRAGLIRDELRKRGKLISEFDILIAAIVQQNKEKLITRDKHFQEILVTNIQIW
jgi:tRNA(fMet)-specific endonuclease VapC